MKDFNVVIAAAPGGHSGYAYAVGYFLRKEYKIRPAFLIPKGYDWLERKLRRVGETIFLPMPRKPGESLITLFMKLPGALLKAIKLMEELEPDVVLVAGSNYSIAPTIAAKLKKNIPIFSIESIVRIIDYGKAVKFLDSLGFTRGVFVHWKEQEKHFRRPMNVGPIFEPPRYKPKDKEYVFVTAGTLGNEELFQAVCESGLDSVVIQTGRVDPKRFERAGIETFSFTDDIDKYLSEASVVIAQFPGMTAANAALAYGKPVVLVPARHLKNSAKLRNAPLFAEKIGAVYIEDVTPEGLEEAVERAKKVKNRLPSYLNGAEKIAEFLVQRTP